MNRLLADLALVCLVAVSLSSCSSVPEPIAQQELNIQADVNAVHDLFRRLDDTATAGDCGEWVPLITDDVLWMVPNQATLVGKDAVRTRLLSLCEQLDMEHISNVQEVEVAREWAFARGIFTFRLTAKAGGATTEETGKFISIFERQVDHSWKISHLIWNNEKPPSQSGTAESVTSIKDGAL